MSAEVIDLCLSSDDDDENDCSAENDCSNAGQARTSRDVALKQSEKKLSAETPQIKKPAGTPSSSSEHKRKIDKLKFHCWNPYCQVPLCNPKARNLELSCYALHSHPLLRIPVCSVCSEEIAEIELKRLEGEKHEVEGEEDVCNTCGNFAQLLFLCDGENCSRAMCGVCVEQANRSSEILEELGASDEEWLCCHCQPTRVVQILQSHVETLAEEIPATKADLDALINEIQMVEEKKAECESALEAEEQQKKEIEKEYSRRECQVNASLFQVQIQEEFDLWKHQHERHYNRLVDMISLLQEDLERQGYNLKEFYVNPTNDENLQQEPEWKRDADNAINEREKQDRKSAPPTKPRSHSEEEIDLDDIEDLGSLSESSTKSESEEHTQWRSSAYRAAKWEIDAALEFEDNFYAERQIPIPMKIEEFQDTDATMAEDQQMAKVRMDSVVVVRQCRQRKYQRSRKRASTTPSTQQREKKRSLSSSASSKSVFSTTRVARRATVEEENLSDSEVHDTLSSRVNGLFQNSSLVINDTEDQRQNQITVAEPLEKVLKPHQKEGVQFMFKQVFADLAFREEQESEKAKANVGGCILAHNMGLGKSLSCVALLHTLFFHPKLRKENGQQKIHTAILVVPVNTLVNWENEFMKWTKDLGSSLRVHNLADSGNRDLAIRKWAKYGGILLLSEATFRSTVKKMNHEKYLRSPGPDLIVLDEAHTMLKGKNKVFTALNGVQTRRRICLTGSPFQNNLYEYFRMAHYIRPGVLAKSERAFEKEFINPILNGLSSDATADAKEVADQKLNEIQKSLEPFLQRKDASVLLQDLPPMQQVVLHVRQTKIQNRLYGAYKKHQQSNEENSKNFLRMYSNLRVVHNHPGCLLMNRGEAKAGKDNGKSCASRQNSKSPETTTATGRLESESMILLSKSEVNIKEEEKSASIKQELIKQEKENTEPESEAFKEEVLKEETTNEQETKKFDPLDDDIIDLISDSEDEVSDCAQSNFGEWWYQAAERSGMDKLSQIESGNKVVLLLHILTHANILGEKVVLFSQCLKTLDFLSDVLTQDDWPSRVSSLAAAFPGHSIGGWKNGKEFLRIDGQTSAGNRGDLITRFNEDSVRLFLISSRAGGIGINLCSASRVVLFDSSFNPTVDMQAIYRCYRYGQKQNVFAYRFLTEGTLEEKVYSRAVNKSSLALSLVDGKNFQRCFTKEETADFNKTDSWVGCDKCSKWRMLPPESIDVSTLPDKWYCEMMNSYDDSMKIDCTFPEKDALWYSRHYTQMKKKDEDDSPIIAMTGDAIANISDETKNRLASRDEILTKLLDVSKGQKKSRIVSRYYFHDALLGKKETEEVTAAKKPSIKKEGAEPLESTNGQNVMFSSVRSAFEKRKSGTLQSSSQPKKRSKSLVKPNLRRKLSFNSLWCGDDDGFEL